MAPTSRSPDRPASRTRKGCLWLCLALALAGLAPAGALAASSGSRVAGTAGESFSACAAHGTIVAVDFAHWGGPIVRGCVTHAGSGLALLQDAGFTVSGAAAYGDAFICRLADAAYAHGGTRPTPAEQNCVNTPGAQAYWSYWLAGAGARHWSYAQLGPVEDRPRAGGIELWNFGATSDSGAAGSGVPRISPAALRSVGTHRLGGVPVLAAAPLAAAGSAGGPGSGSGGGSSAGLIVGLGVVVALLAASGWATRRRRRSVSGA